MMKNKDYSNIGKMFYVRSTGLNRACVINDKIIININTTFTNIFISTHMQFTWKFNEKVCLNY